MTDTWLVVALVGAATIAIKAIGPVLLGGRELPPRIAIADRSARAGAARRAGRDRTRSATGSRSLLDERLLGVAAAGIAIWRKAPVLLVVVIAAAVTAAARALL